MMATWNVLTLKQPGKMQEVASEMAKYNIDLIALQEVRWQGNGRIDKPDFSLMYSGNEENTGLYGTGFLVNKSVRKSVMEYEAVNDRLCRLRLKGKFRNITIISAYAPTNSDDIFKKETFYEKLEEICQKVPKYDMLLVMGDFNAQIGKNEDQKQVSGPHTLHDANNENGELLSEFAIRNKLFIRSTSFQHKSIHLGTWKRWGTNDINQIDHVLVSTRHFSSVTDVRSCRGPNCDSDHFLVKTKIRERLSTIPRKNKAGTTKWNTDSLKNDPICAAEYQSALRNKMEATGRTNIHNDDDDVDAMWNDAKTIIMEVAEEQIGQKEWRRNQEWFDEECKQIINQKNIARTRMMNVNTRNNAERYHTLRKESKKIMRRKKRDALKEKIKEIDALSKENEQRKFYAAVNRMTKKFQPKINACRNTNGDIITDEEVVLKRWEQHFKELLNEEQSEPTSRTNEQILEDDNVNIPTISEIRKSIMKMKNNRAPGDDNITAELLKYGGDAVETMMLEIISTIWEKEKMPENWTTGVLCPILKKGGDKTNCNNYRGIMLLNTAYKVLTSILNERLKEISEAKIGEYQCGFRRDKGTSDQIFVMRQIMEKCNEQRKNA
uniref:Craniofacial development protein 2 n=1 Tax=Cacopsylla melanoneura TaxID=428564 RepID=A0A8D8XYL8_9HEMI